MGLFDSASKRDLEQLRSRIARLESLVELLARKQGVSDAELASLHTAVGVPVSPTVRQLALEGRKIQAIKLLREETGLGLKEAKDTVEAL